MLEFVGAAMAVVFSQRARHCQGVAMRCKDPVRAATWTAKAEAFNEAANIATTFQRRIDQALNAVTFESALMGLDNHTMN